MKTRTLILAAGAALALAAPAAYGMPLQPEGAAVGSAASHYSARALQAMGDRYQAAAQSYASQTAVRPDDRAGSRGSGQFVQADQTDALSRYLVNNAPAVRPDDRGGIRGVGRQPVSTPHLAVRPDDRAGVRDVGGLAVWYDGKLWGTIDVPAAVANEPGGGLSSPVSTPQTSTRPDNRPGVRGIGETPVDVVSNSPSGGFDWGIVGIGLGSSAFALILLSGALLLNGRRRSQPAAG